MAFAQEFRLKVILSHVTRANDILDKIASYHVPVIVGPIYDLPGANERFDAVYSVPGELAKRGVLPWLAGWLVRQQWGPWRMSRERLLCQALPPEWFAEQGLLNLAPGR